MRVLLVEPGREEREALARVIRARAHQVTLCESGEDALQQQALGAFPLIALGTGLAPSERALLCRKLRALPSGESPVVIACLGAGEQDEPTAALEAGADDYLAFASRMELLASRLLVAERRAHERLARSLRERTLASSEAGLRALIEGMPQGVIVHRGDRIVYANREALHALGYDPVVGLIGQSFIALVHTEDLDAAKMSSERTAPTQLRLLRRDGSFAELEAVLIPMTFAGESAVVALLRDLAPQRQLEQRVLLSEHMASLGTLTAGIAHELNNPLSYVLANLRFLREDIEGLKDALGEPQLNALLELATQASEGAERVHTIAQDLKRFSRVDARDEDPADVARVLDSAINMTWNEIRHRAQLEKRYEQVPPVRGQEARLGQVFLNLLINAAQAIPIGHASENTIKVAVLLRGDRVWVEIADSGCGMPEAVVQRIFEPFFTTKPVGVGTGLGLSICRDILAEVGATIAVESNVGQGSIFRVSLPLAQQTSVKPRLMPSLPAPANGRSLRILIVDDEPAVARALRRALKEHDVSSAEGGREAIGLFESGESYDLVFCDLMMADVSGMALYEWVRTQRAGKEAGFVFMTGGVFSQQATDFLAGLPNPIVHKPFDIRALRKLVGQRIAA